MNCAFCGRELQAIRPSKRYCNNACRQADYRRRHQSDHEDITELKMQLAQAKQRIQELERNVTQLTQALKGRQVSRNVTVSVGLVELGKFADLHGVSRDDAHRGITIGSLHPIEQDGKLMLDAHNQRTFWELNHNYGHWWRDCDACPHTELEETSTTRKPSESHPRGYSVDLPEGGILARDFARMHGVNHTTFRDHITIGIGKGLPADQKDRVQCSERPKQGRPNEIERYLTPEQQQAALDYWKRHGVKFNEPEA
jgi:hypothetical protein